MTEIGLPRQFVSVDSLDRCEFCGHFFSIGVVSGEAMAVPWHCPHCGKLLTAGSFGMAETEPGQFKKVKWIGPNGQWMDNRPERPFTLKRFRVLAEAAL